MSPNISVPSVIVLGRESVFEGQSTTPKYHSKVRVMYTLCKALNYPYSYCVKESIKGLCFVDTCEFYINTQCLELIGHFPIIIMRRYFAIAAILAFTYQAKAIGISFTYSFYSLLFIHSDSHLININIF